MTLEFLTWYFSSFKKKKKEGIVFLSDMVYSYLLFVICLVE